jgi:hypothetical protein
MGNSRTGIPYARKSLEPPWHEICPICGMSCPQVVDNVGEQIQGTYAKHYAEIHAAGTQHSPALLLEALEELVGWFGDDRRSWDGWEGVDEVLDQAEAAIAKAKEEVSNG